MKKPNVEEVLQQGIHGPLETKPDERRKFLGTLRERIIVSLKKSQVAEADIYPQVEREMETKSSGQSIFKWEYGLFHFIQICKISRKA